MKNPTEKKPSRRRRTTPLDVPDEQSAPTLAAAADEALEPPSEHPALAEDTQRPSSGEEIPRAEMVPDLAEDELQEQEPVTVYFRKVQEEGVAPAHVEEAAVTTIPPSSYHEDGPPTPKAPAFEADSRPELATDAIFTEGSDVPDSLPLEPAAVDLPLPPLPVMLFALILLALAV